MPDDTDNTSRYVKTPVLLWLNSDGRKPVP